MSALAEGLQATSTRSRSKRSHASWCATLAWSQSWVSHSSGSAPIAMASRHLRRASIRHKCIAILVQSGKGISSRSSNITVMRRTSVSRKGSVFADTSVPHGLEPVWGAVVDRLVEETVHQSARVLHGTVPDPPAHRGQSGHRKSGHRAHRARFACQQPRLDFFGLLGLVWSGGCCGSGRGWSKSRFCGVAALAWRQAAPSRQ